MYSKSRPQRGLPDALQINKWRHSYSVGIEFVLTRASLPAGFSTNEGKNARRMAEEPLQRSQFRLSESRISSIYALRSALNSIS
jgi:hypothetical protein